MTRTYALRKLLEHGPLYRQEIRVITGWGKDQVEHAIDDLMDDKTIKTVPDNYSGNVRFSLSKEVRYA